MNQTTTAQAKTKTLLSGYEKFHFLTHEDAKKAAMLLGEKYPTLALSSKYHTLDHCLQKLAVL